MPFPGNLFGQNNLGSQMGQASKDYTSQFNQGLGSINNGFAAYNPEFYNQGQQAFQQAHLPQLQQQGLGMQRQMGLGLANQGLWHSGASDSQQRMLSSQLAGQQRGLASGSMDYRNALQQQVAQEHARMIQQLQQSLMPQQMRQQALGMAAQAGGPSGMAPFGQALGSLGTLGVMGAMI